MNTFFEMVGLALILAIIPFGFLAVVWFDGIMDKRNAAKKAEKQAADRRKYLEQKRFNDRMNHKMQEEKKAAYAASIASQQIASREANQARKDRKIAKGLTMLSSK